MADIAFLARLSGDGDLQGAYSAVGSVPDLVHRHVSDWFCVVISGNQARYPSSPVFEIQREMGVIKSNHPETGSGCFTGDVSFRDDRAFSREYHDQTLTSRASLMPDLSRDLPDRLWFQDASIMGARCESELSQHDRATRTCRLRFVIKLRALTFDRVSACLFW